ncbi:tail fiber assembly protein [Aeromonas sp. SG16]|uniref:tail fiber assembly protein n=1 Tax=Aeromonas sp. SG16 TaxID=2950548 RepID=UPI00210C880B|nr:tail fiber assembly protein [Aeromonas sp. SG16]MCQ4053376.1 tail fiber assembly protein [Aeromonas sp. SG16]
MMYFSEKEQGFYDSRIHSTIPEDAQELTQEEYQIKLAELSVGGSTIDPVQAAESLLASAMAEANKQISIIKPAVDGGYAKPEHTKLLADWQRYRYELTLVPEQTGWPESPQLPTEPEKVI